MVYGLGLHIDINFASDCWVPPSIHPLSEADAAREFPSFSQGAKFADCCKSSAVKNSRVEIETPFVSSRTAAPTLRLPAASAKLHKPGC